LGGREPHRSGRGEALTLLDTTEVLAIQDLVKEEGL
jgi:hypothetical protein